MPSLAALDRQFLVERQLISRELAAVLDGPRGVAFDSKESVSVMVNEEDHLRLQVLRSGFALDEAWSDIDKLDDALEARLTYAFHAQFGYLTACPTNVGTGMRASVMLHLPALGLTKQIEKVFRALQKINLAVRGLYGEGSRAFGDLYQISNQVTLGKSESKILGEIREVIQTILQYERQARTALLKERRQAEQDRVARALGTLGSATMITAEETMELLSAVRLGIHLRLIDDIPATDGEPALHPDAGGAPPEADGPPARRRGAERAAGEVPQGPPPRTRLAPTMRTVLPFAVFALFLGLWTWKLLEPNPVPEPVVRGIPTDLKFWLAKALHAGAYAFLTVLAAWLPLRRPYFWGVVALPGTARGRQRDRPDIRPEPSRLARDVVIDWVGIGMGLMVSRWWRWGR